MLGLELTKIHRVLSFRQTRFLKPYIDFCTAKRAGSTSDFKKKLWKLCVNSCFGKFIESVRKYQRCSIVTDANELGRLVASPFASSTMIVNEECVIVMKKMSVVKMNKPIAVGFTILDRSKDFMYETFYKQIKPRFERCIVIFSDTDSLCLEIHSPTPICPLSKLTDIMDFSNYPAKHPMYNATRKNQLFFFKDEVCGDSISKYVGLRAKCYSFTTRSGKEERKLKGVTKAYRSQFSLSHYMQCLTSVKHQSVSQYHIRSRNHKIALIQATRVALSSYDCNRYMLKCGIHTLAYGFNNCLYTKHDYCNLEKEIHYTS